MTNITGDHRSQKIVVCCHCVLNQNAKLEGIAGWDGAIREVGQLLLDSGAGILQIPCPEMIYEGIGRFDKSVEQYDCAAFHEICERIAQEIVSQMKNYLDWGYQIPALLAIDGSPSCGFNLAQSAPEWRGLVAGKNWKKVRYIERNGILMEHIVHEMKSQGIDIKIIGIPEIPELGDLEDTLKSIRSELES
jgi:predicted secreted protein